MAEWRHFIVSNASLLGIHQMGCLALVAESLQLLLVELHEALLSNDILESFIEALNISTFS